MNWYVLLDGQQTGPLTDDQMKQMIFSGQIKPGDLVWNENLPQWVEAGSVRGLFAPGDQIPVRNSTVSSGIVRQKKNTGLIVALSIMIVFLIVLAGLLVRFLFFGDSEETTTMETEITQPESSETEPQGDTETEPQITETTTEAVDVTETETTQPAATTTTTEAETTVSETEADPVISQDEILEIMHLADLTALGFFTEAFETELDGGSKVPFDEIRPALLEYWSEYMVDEVLFYFYDEYLFDWGYEMVQIFPFHDMETLENSFIEIYNQTDEEIIVYTYIAETMMYDGYALNAILVYENGRWVVDDYYSEGAD